MFSLKMPDLQAWHLSRVPVRLGDTFHDMESGVAAMLAAAIIFHLFTLMA